MDRIVDDKKGHLLIYIGNHSYKLKKERYGEFAQPLAEKCIKDKIRYQDYFEEFDTYVVFYINCLKEGVQKVYVDKEDAHLFFDRKISVYRDPHTNSCYAGTKDGKVHRIIMNANKGEYVDHINHDTLDNRKENLRIANNSLNAKNSSIRKDSKTGIRGVFFEPSSNSYVCFWVDKEGKRHQKKFTIKKYGKEIAFQMAVTLRKQMEEENDYL